MVVCACQYAICQSLPVFPEISTVMLEIATLGDILGPMHDSCDWSWSGGAYWMIMCMQLVASTSSCHSA